MGRHARPKNIHPLLPKVYKLELVDNTGRHVKTERIYYAPLPFNRGLVKYPYSWSKPAGGCYGATGISIRSRFWALYDWADHADFDERGEYILGNIRQRANNSVRVKK